MRTTTPDEIVSVPRYVRGMKDAVGDRFKAIEHQWRHELPRRGFAVVRVDGRAFHTWTRGLPKPYSSAFMYAMDVTAIRLCEEF